jgi:galactofuranose transport system substrate-binding protein
MVEEGRSKRVFILGVLAVLGFALVISIAFSMQVKKDEGIKYLIGVSHANLTDAWQVAMNEEIRREIKKYPNAKAIFFDAASDNVKQKQDIENMVKQKADLIIISPNDSHYITSTLSGVYKKGIPVIMMEYPIESKDYSMLIYTNNKTIGRNAGQLVADLGRGMEGVVLEIQGDPDSRVSKERKEGFRDVIGNQDNIILEYTVVGYWSRDKAEERVGEILKKEPPVNIIFAHNEAMAIGAWRAANKQGKNIIIIGVDGLLGKNGGVEAVREGILEATFSYPTGGREAVMYAIKLLNNEEIPKKLELQSTMITRENVLEFLERKHRGL